MSKEPLNGVKISSLVEQVGCKTVAKYVDASGVGQTGFFFAR
jgi:ABC-type proline/glycine betaine transport system permease subunit